MQQVTEILHYGEVVGTMRNAALVQQTQNLFLTSGYTVNLPLTNFTIIKLELARLYNNMLLTNTVVYLITCAEQL